jgi:hypothetical protein
VWTKIINTYQGSEGVPGNYYEVIRGHVEKREERFRVRITAERGSNQGRLEAHDNVDLEARGDTVGEALAAIRDDVEELNGWLSLQERHQLLRDLEYEYEDRLT